MLTISITSALQTRIPILGSETRCARRYLACLVALVLVLVLRLAPRKRYLVMILKLDWERSQTLEVLSFSYHLASHSNPVSVFNCVLDGGCRITYISLDDHQALSVLLDVAVAVRVVLGYDAYYRSQSFTLSYKLLIDRNCVPL